MISIEGFIHDWIRIPSKNHILGVMRKGKMKIHHEEEFSSSNTILTYIEYYITIFFNILIDVCINIGLLT